LTNQDFRVKNGLQVGVGGTVFTADIGGKVGINSTSPTATLDIQGTVKSSGTITAPTFAGTATTANNLSNAANITTGTISADRLSGNYNISISGSVAGDTISISTASVSNNLNVGSGNTGVFATGGGNLRVSGITTLGVTSTTNLTTQQLNVSGITTLGVTSTTNLTTQQLNVSGVSTFTGAVTGTISTATKLENSRTFEITGDVVASPVSFDGTGNVSLAATIQPNSVALGSDTTGDYVQSISGTSNQITVTGGTGESSTPTLSVPNQFTAPQDVTVIRDLQVNRNLNVNGNITIGGTAATLFTTELKVADPDLVLGFRTDGSGNDVSNDTTANHGGIAVASTEGNPLVQLFIAGIETTPSTYKKIMWFKAGEFAGLNTDAWLSNYAVGIGSTQFPTGTRLAAGSVQFTENDLAVVRNINASGIITGTLANTLTLNTSGTGLSGSATYNNSGATTFTVTSNATSNNTSSTIVARDASGNFSAGTITASLTGTASTASFATTAFNLSDAANITTGTINSARLSGTYNIDISGNASTAGVSTSVIGGIGSITQLQVTGISTFSNGPVLIGSATSTGTASQRLQVTGGAYVSGNLGIGTTDTSYKLDVIGRVRATNDIDLVSTTGTLSITGRPNGTIGGNYPAINIEYPSGGSLYALYAWQDTGNDRVYQQLANSTDYFTALDSDSEFIIGLKGAGLLGGSTYSFKIDIDAETSLYYNQSEKLTTTQSGVSVTGLTSTTTLNVGTGGTVITTTAAGLVGIGTTNPTSKLDVRGAITVGGAVSITAERDSGNNDVIYFNPLNESRVSIGINTTLNWSSLSNIPDVAFVADKTIGGYPKIAIANPTQASPFYQLRATYANASALYGYVRQDIDNGSYAIALDNSATAFSVGDRTSLDSTRASNFSAANEAFVVILNGSTSLFHSKSKKFETSGVGVTVYGNLNVGTGGTVITTTASGLVGIGTTNPTSKLDVRGNTYLDGDLDITGDITSVGNIGVLDTKTLSFVGGSSVFSNPQITIAAVNSASNLYQLLAYDVTSGTDYVLELIKTATDRQFLLGNNREFVVAYDPLAYPADSSQYAFKVKIGAETSLYHNQSEKLTTTGYGVTITGGLSVSGVTTTGRLNVGTGGTVITTTIAGLVGIGTTNPTSKLHVIGDARVGIDTSQGVILTSSNGTKYRLIVSDAGVLSTVLVT